MLRELGDSQRKDLLKAQSSLKFKVNEALSGVAGALDRSLESLAAAIEAKRLRGEPVSPYLLYEQDRLRKIQKEIQAELDKAAPALASITTKEQKKAVAQAARDALKALRPTDVLANEIFQFDKEAVETLVGFGLDGAKNPLRGLYTRLGEPLAKALESRLVYGLAVGESNQQIARDVRQILNTTVSRALTIARTETTRAYREASRSIYNSNKKALQGYAWISATDLRTCVICWRFHGKIFSTATKFRTHPNCRCTMIPVPKNTKETIETGEEIFEKLTDAQKREILGSGRFEAYQAGATLRGMVAYKKTPYGETPVLIPIDKIKLPKGSPKLKAKTPAKPTPAPKPIEVPAPIGEIAPVPIQEDLFPAD